MRTLPLILFSMLLLLLPNVSAIVSSVDALSIKTFSVELYDQDLVEIEVVPPEDGIYFAFEDPSGEPLAGNCYLKEGKNYTLIINRSGDYKLVFDNAFSPGKKSFYFRVLMYPGPVSGHMPRLVTMPDEQYFLFRDPNAWAGVFVVLLAIVVLIFGWRVHKRYQ